MKMWATCVWLAGLLLMIGGTFVDNLGIIIYGFGAFVLGWVWWAWELTG